MEIADAFDRFLRRESRTNMVKFCCGIGMLGFGAILVLWVAYNLLIARQREYSSSLCSLLFIAGLFFVGAKWASEGWQHAEKLFRPKKRRKKKKRRRVVEEEDDE